MTCVRESRKTDRCCVGSRTCAAEDRRRNVFCWRLKFSFSAHATTQELALSTGPWRQARTSPWFLLHGTTRLRVWLLSSTTLRTASSSSLVMCCPSISHRSERRLRKSRNTRSQTGSEASADFRSSFVLFATSPSAPRTLT